jgi:uncharacterized membrane protein YphA (DoxX/SURF4 family)
MRLENRNKMWPVVAFWFLVLSYTLGSLAFAIVEASTRLFSERFDYPPTFLHLVSGTQFVCAVMLFKGRIAPWSLIILTAISVGAVYSHFRIGSPVTSLPAVAYTMIQAWYWLYLYRQDQSFRTR